jgi:uncharacterized membrane protein YkoI
MCALATPFSLAEYQLKRSQPMNFKSLSIAMLAVVSLGGSGKLAAQAATHGASPLFNGQASTATRAACATVPVLEQDAWGSPDKPAITAAAAQQIAEAHVQAGCARQIKLDEEDCRLIYKVKFIGVKVEVDATTGVVIDIDY